MRDPENITLQKCLDHILHHPNFMKHPTVPIHRIFLEKNGWESLERGSKEQARRYMTGVEEGGSEGQGQQEEEGVEEGGWRKNS